MASEEPQHPEIYASTHALLRHLQREGAQTPRQLEQVLGDVDQIGPDQIEQWIAWAVQQGSLEPTGGGRYNITDHGQSIVGVPRDPQ